MIGAFAQSTAASTRHAEFANLEKAIDVIAEQVRGFDTADADSSLRSLLQTVYEFRTIDARKPEDSEFVAVAEAIDTALHRMSQGLLVALSLGKESALELLLWSLSKQHYYPEPEEAIIDLEGWLELPWNDAPFLIVTGMNDGSVPKSRPADVFLPDTLRRQLNLHHDEDRLVTDAYLMTALIESRREKGRVCFTVGKTGSTGDVLKPSRLLFQCSDDDLAHRAERLFGTPVETRVSCPSSISFRLEAVPPPDVPEGKLELKKISATTFSEYLECPFRFYLKRMLDMKALDDQKIELDALDFGSLVHDTLHEMGLNEETRQSNDVAHLEDFLCTKATNWITERLGPSPPLQVEVQLESAMQRLRRAAQVQAGLVSQGWEIVRCEMEIEGEMEGVLVRGKIDRIDRHRQTGKIRVLDYKTSENAGTPEEAHLGSLPKEQEWPEYAKVEVAGRQRRWIDLQLLLYSVLLSCDQELRGPFELGYFNMPKALDDIGVVLWNDLTEALLESADACARGVINDIKSRRFWPPAQKPRYDEFESLFAANPALCVNTEAFEAFLKGKTS